MSKSLNTFAPILGGTALVLGVAYGATSRDYARAEIEMLETRNAQVQAQVSQLSEAVASANADNASMTDQLAALETTMAAMANSSGPMVDPITPHDGPHGLGRAAHEAEISAWDLDVRPDGTGLPVGSGDVLTGEELFSDNCAVCHGEFAEGVDNWPKLAGGDDTLADKDPLKTVGSYWPYLSTAWDYVNRSMPFGNAQSLEPDEVYAIVAYILYSNDIVDDEEFVLSNENFLDVEMPNAGGFIVDDRPTAEYEAWRSEPCMENCKDSVEITMRATVLDVTPEETEAKAEAETAVVAVAETSAPATQSAAALDMELVAAGENVFKKCKSCHQVGQGASNKTGPILNGIVGAAAGGVDGFRYSSPLKKAAEGGLVWDETSLAEFLAAPKAFLKGTKMSFAGIKKADDISAVIEYLRSNP